MDPQLEEPDLRSYLRVIARRRWLVVLTTVAFVGIAVAVSLIPAPQYRVEARVQTTGVNDPIALIFGNGGGDLERQAASELAYIGSSEVRAEAARAYGGDLEGDIYRVAVDAVPMANPNVTSSVVELSLVSDSPEEAATLLNVYADAYVELRGVHQSEALIGQQDLIQGYLDDVEAEIAQVKDEAGMTELEAAVAAGTASPEQVDRLNALRDQVAPRLAPLRTQAGELQGRIADIRFGVVATTGGAAAVLSYAGVPDTPVSPNIPLNLAIGLVFGLFLGAALAFVRDYFDDSVKTKEVVEQVAGVSTLGLVPKIESGQSELVTVSHPSAPAAEAFRSLRTAVKFLAVERQVRVVQVTSPSPTEGKTLVAVNLAVAFAQAGDRVVVVGGDLRRPRLERMLDVPLTPGLTGVLIGDVTLPQAIQTVGAVPNLSVLPAGQPPPNPSELLSGERARRLIDVLGQTYDVVVIDCPPVLPVTDALVLANMADTSLLVASGNQTSKRELVRAVELLRQVEAPLAGTVLNSLSADATFSTEPYRYDTAPPGQMPTKPRRRLGAGNGNGNGADARPGGGAYDDGGPGDETGGRRLRQQGPDSRSGEWAPAPSPGPPHPPQHTPPGSRW